MSAEPYDPDAIVADPHAHPIQRMYAAINVGIRDRGEQWSKCANCGDPYQITEAWSALESVSKSCHRSYVNYLNNQEWW